MCLMLYVASEHPLPVRSAPELRVEPVGADRAAVRRWFSLPEVRFVGAHTGCSCGFPSVIADVPIVYYDGFFDDDEPERAKDLASVKALFAVIDEALRGATTVELFPVWSSDEAEEPNGVVEIRRADLVPERFFFTADFLYRVNV